MKILAILSGVFLMGCANAEIQLSRLFSDNMILQRDRPIPVWGVAAPGAEVTVRFKGSVRKTAADAAGQWRAELPPVPASAVPDRLVIQTRSEQRILNNVLVGDVWLCAGQSNMGDDFGYSPDTRYPPGLEIAAELRKIDNPRIRIIARNGLGDINPLPGRRSGFPFTEWSECNPGTMKYFSRAGYYFGATLERELGVPVGLINVSRGCSSIEAWMPGEALDPENRKAMREFQTFFRNYPARVSPEEQRKVFLEHCRGPFGEFPTRCCMRDGTIPPDRFDQVMAHMLVVKPAALFHHAIDPIIPFAIKGVVWYQGETNLRDTAYAGKLRRLIDSWRRRWNQNDFPFYLVQLAPCRDAAGVSLPDFWMRQYLAIDRVPNTGMICAADIGDPAEYHPENKRDIGRRLALLALRDAYGRRGVVASGPVFRSMRTRENRISIEFDSVGSGLKTRDGRPPAGFEIAGDDRRFVPADAAIDGNRVTVAAPAVKNPRFARYAWNNRGDGTLCNREGLPAFPFNTENAYFQNSNRRIPNAQ